MPPVVAESECADSYPTCSIIGTVPERASRDVFLDIWSRVDAMIPRQIETHCSNPRRNFRLDGLATAAARKQTDGSTQLEQWVTRGFDAFNSRYRIENDPPMRFVIGSFRREHDSPERKNRSIGRPVVRGVIYDVAIISDLHLDVELNRACCDAALYLVEKVTRILGLGGRVIEVLDARPRHDLIPAVA